MKIKTILGCILSMVLIIGGIHMYRISTGIQMLETPVIIGHIYIWGFRILTPIGLVGLAVSSIKIKRNGLLSKAQEVKEEKDGDDLDKTKELLD